MKFLFTFACFFVLSVAIMTGVDFLLGDQAEYLNAFSVLQRILGIEPTAGMSEVAQQYGVNGEFLAVLLANAVVSLVLTLLYRRLIGSRIGS